jgi:hypothetical protein
MCCDLRRQKGAGLDFYPSLDLRAQIASQRAWRAINLALSTCVLRSARKASSIIVIATHFLPTQVSA